MTWKELFPDALLGENGQDTVPVTLNGEVIYLLESSLTERERSSKPKYTTDKSSVIPTHPLTAHLAKAAHQSTQHIPMAQDSGGISKARRRLSRKRLVGVRRELKRLGPLPLFQNFRHHYTLVVNPEVATSLASTLFEVQSAIEDDFAVELQLYREPLGNVKPCAASLSSRKAFVEYLMHSHKRSSLEFCTSDVAGDCQRFGRHRTDCGRVDSLLSEDDVKN